MTTGSVPGSLSQAIRAAVRHRSQLIVWQQHMIDRMAAQWAGVEVAMEARIAALSYQVAEMQAAGEAVNAWRLAEISRYQDLLVGVQGQIAQYTETVLPEMAAGQRAMETMGVEHAADSIQAALVDAGAEVPLTFNVIPPAVVETMAGMAGVGAPLGDLFQASWPDAIDGLTNALLNGLAMGDNPRDVARAMQDGMTDGLDRMMTIARTEMLRSYREATRQEYIASGVVTSYKRICAHNEDTCLSCLAMDGQEYENNELMELHPNDRCAMIPVVLDMPAVEWRSGENWLFAQDEGVQREIMGDARYELMVSGKVVDLHDFVSVTQSPEWGPTLGLVPLSDLPGGAPELAGEPTGREGQPTADRDEMHELRVAGERFMGARLDDLDVPDLPEEEERTTDNEAVAIAAKMYVADTLSGRTGLDDERVSQVVHGWAFTSNDNDLRALSIQWEVARIFGVEMSPWQMERLEAMVSQSGASVDALHEVRPDSELAGLMGQLRTSEEDVFGASANGEGTASLLQSMYDQSQEQLQAAGVEELVLYRGVSIDADSALADSVTEAFAAGSQESTSGMTPEEASDRMWLLSRPEIDITEPNALESWSLDPNVAQDFASGRGAMGIVLEMRVPAERVFSSPFAGFGCLNEKEVVILGHAPGSPPDVGRIFSRRGG